MPRFSRTFVVMNIFRSLFLMRAVIFLVASMVLYDSIDCGSGSVATSSNSSEQVIVKAADDRGSDDWEGRFTSPEAQLFKSPFYEVILVTPFTMVDVNFSDVTTHFTSVPSELPSPPPRG